MLRTSTALLPPLSQPRLPVVPSGVCAETLALPAALISPLVTVTCIFVLLRTWVGIVVPLITATVDATNLLPVSVSTNPV